MFSVISYLCRQIKPEKLVVLNVDSLSVACFVRQISPTKTISTAFFSRLWCDGKTETVSGGSFLFMMTLVQSGPERLMKAYPRVLSFTQLLWTRVTKRNREQREMAPVSTALTNSTVQLPNRKTWTNNSIRKAL